ncbi:hypothetical protein Pcinc_039946 [Petrolisthes cinctipes]|uniref:Uncharacterized protein n=1 Tax=Petrolisthes cinctipes TaxID=88211 RepID=A0AAE1BMV9_PETCI|nr:hypothetical protein Pcinc_039946 [Petrolisthes cinctipes]
MPSSLQQPHLHVTLLNLTHSFSPTPSSSLTLPSSLHIPSPQHLSPQLAPPHLPTYSTVLTSHPLLPQLLPTSLFTLTSSLHPGGKRSFRSDLFPALGLVVSGLGMGL